MDDAPHGRPAADATARPVLVLGGTAEANALVKALRQRWPERRLILSLAGRTRSPELPEDAEIRIGGFGGAEGLAAFLLAESVSLVVDATHPFAAGMARNAARAADLAGLRRLKLLRPEWCPVAGDCWTPVTCLAEACRALPAGARPFLALGRQHLSPFTRRSDIRPLARMIEPPEPALPAGWTLILSRPSSDRCAEADLMRAHGITHLVTRNAGGAASYAKVAAARDLGLPVIMIARPPSPAGAVFETVEDVVGAIG
ncbi:cobalt-precorrin-6A reductase [Aurantimonas sp. 22II-16-19i]|uniref:cobalt-precorrin-6A reductase n=1 Tax=Aurantimonas sp. 22II-16-19i TaxID=1317114 RepID=UPI0009F7F808|nr:cobalt-precorrin-6A reductase [Aurantimonas sp. 22II-16-19i]ORE94786.1 cobalt-precorrin-6x reductase [Aurantimonas sp. 22II-16-19i]